MTEKQKRFCDYYIASANSYESYKKAGYKGKEESLRAAASNLLAKPHIQEYIKARSKELESERIASIEEVQEFWTREMRNEENDKNHRIRASELLAKSKGAFIEKKEIKAEVEQEINVRLIDDDE